MRLEKAKFSGRSYLEIEYDEALADDMLCIDRLLQCFTDMQAQGVSLEQVRNTVTISYHRKSMFHLSGPGKWFETSINSLIENSQPPAVDRKGLQKEIAPRQLNDILNEVLTYSEQ